MINGLNSTLASRKPVFGREVSDLDVYALIRALEQPHWPKQLVNEIKKYQTIEKIERITLSKIKNKEE